MDSGATTRATAVRLPWPRRAWRRSPPLPPEPLAWAYRGNGYPGGGRLHQGLVTTCIVAASRRWTGLFFGGSGTSPSRSLSFLRRGKPSDGRHWCRQWCEGGEASEMGRDGRRGLRPLPFIAGEGQPAPPTITGNDGFSLHVAGTCQVGQLPRQRGEAETPTSNQRTRVDQGRRLLGPVALCTCPLPSARSQVRARLGPGGYCRCSGNGGPQTCLPAAHGVALRAGPYGPSSSTSIQDPHEGPSLARRTTQDLLQGSLTKLAHEGRRDQGKENLVRFQ